MVMIATAPSRSTLTRFAAEDSVAMVVLYRAGLAPWRAPLHNFEFAERWSRSASCCHTVHPKRQAQGAHDLDTGAARADAGRPTTAEAGYKVAKGFRSWRVAQGEVGEVNPLVRRDARK
jgi:hypothetical protein